MAGDATACIGAVTAVGVALVDATGASLVGSAGGATAGIDAVTSVGAAVAAAS